MQAPVIPQDEGRRLEALRRLDILDTPAEARFDRLTRIAQRHFGVRIALVSLVDADRLWFKSKQGLDACEAGRDASFCGHAILADDTFTIPNAVEDPRFADNPLVTGGPGIRFYAGAPLHAPDGQRVGALCLIDPKPRTLSADDLAILRDLADGVEAELDRTHLLRAADEAARLAIVAERTDNAVIITDADGLIEWVNQGFERISGYTLAEAIGRKPGAVLQGPDTDPATVACMRDKLRAGEACQTEILNYHKNGTPCWLSLGIQPIRDDRGHIIRFIAIVSDVTERKRIESDLKSGEARIRAIVDTVVDGIISIDAHGIIRTINPAAERIFGYSREEMLGHNVNMLMPEPYRSAHDGYLHSYLATGEKKIIGIGREVTGQRKDGSTFPMDVAVSEMRVGDERMFTGVARDITERKRLEQIKSEFVSTVSHELRTPLTSIRGALGLVVGRFADVLPDKARHMLEMAERNSERLTLLINDILDLEKIESGRLEFEFRPDDLVALAQRALEDNEGYARRHDVQLSLDTTLDAAPIHGDAHRLLQVFANLISNAVKYSPAQGTVEIAVLPHAGGWRVAVRDHGSGIPEAFRNRIFQRYAQADSSDTRAQGGTGLGLSIAKAIVERHEGRIGYETESRVGATFHFDLPAWQARIESAPDAARPASVLICEDNAYVAEILAALLEQEGQGSDIAATAAAARDLLARNAYRLMLLDLTLPDADGLTLLRELRGEPATRALPIIVVSGRAREGQAEAGASVQVVDWLQKPLDRDRFSQAVNQALRVGGRPRILHVEDDLDVVQVVGALLEESADLSHAATCAEARRLLAEQRFDLVILDLTLAVGSGEELLEDLRGGCPVAIFSGHEPGPDLTRRVSAALTKSQTSNDQLLATIKNILNANGSGT